MSTEQTTSQHKETKEQSPNVTLHNESHPTDREKLKVWLRTFISPVKPLREAIVTFFQTSIGIVIGLLILICLVVRITTMINHHRFGHREQRGGYQVKEYTIQ